MLEEEYGKVAVKKTQGYWCRKSFHDGRAVEDI
jgi:hypothetical protein